MARTPHEHQRTAEGILDALPTSHPNSPAYLARIALAQLHASLGALAVALRDEPAQLYGTPGDAQYEAEARELAAELLAQVDADVVTLVSSPGSFLYDSGDVVDLAVEGNPSALADPALRAKVEAATPKAAPRRARAPKAASK